MQAIPRTSLARSLQLPLQFPVCCPLCCPSLYRRTISSASAAASTSSSSSPRRRKHGTDSSTVPTSVQAARDAAADAAPTYMRGPLPPASRGGEPSARPMGRTLPLGIKVRSNAPRPATVDLQRREAGPSKMPEPVKVVRQKPAFRTNKRRSMSTSAFADKFTAGLEQGYVVPADVRRQMLQEGQISAKSSGHQQLGTAGEDIEGADRSEVQQEQATFHEEITLEGEAPETEILQDPDAAAVLELDGVPGFPVQPGSAHSESKQAWHPPRFAWPDGGPPVPTSAGHLVRILQREYSAYPSDSTLLALVDLHNAHIRLASVASFNVLLGQALHQSNLALFNGLLERMARRRVRFDGLTWDLLMESYAANGRWAQLVESYEKREAARSPMTRKGWTRVARAATREGSTSLQLPEAKVDEGISPLYGAAYGHNQHLPYGVRQATLRSMLQKVRMDVDRLLAAMMPNDMHPLDFHATAVLGQRLAKQRRWREAYDLVGDWLDGASTSASSEKPTTTPGTPGSGADGKLSEGTALEAARIRQQRARTLLHILIEGLVVSRTSPRVLRSFVDSVLAQHSASLGLRPTYHTVYLLLTAYRSEETPKRFTAAADAFEDASAKWQPDLSLPSAERSLEECRRLLGNLARFTPKSIPEEARDKLVREKETRWKALRERIDELRIRARQARQDTDHGALGRESRPRHIRGRRRRNPDPGPDPDQESA